MTIVQRCNHCKNKSYIEREGKCFSCIRKEDPDSVLVGLHLHMVELDEEYLSVVEKAQSSFPRIVHTRDYDEIIDFYETELNLLDEFAVLKDFDVRYIYSKYDRRTKKERVLEALKDAYRDSIEVKFQES